MPKLIIPDEIICIEPHPDDAFLSLGEHLEVLWATQPRRIVSVYSDERRAKEGEAYARAIGASYECLGVGQYTSLGETYGGGVEPALEAFLAGLEGGLVLFPVGLQHPDHLRVAASLAAHYKPGERYRVGAYLDSPYAAKIKLQEEVLQRTRGMRVASMTYPPKRKWRHIPIFQSQSKFFHFNPMVDLRLPELVLTP